jgi:hypothetical protein
MSKENEDFSVRGGCGCRGDEWVVDGPDGLICGEFGSESEAIASAKLWSEKVGRAIKMTWTAPRRDDDDYDDSDRGDYCIALVGTKYEWHSPGGWHAMEHSMLAARRIYDAVAKHGVEAARDLLSACE